MNFLDSITVVSFAAAVIAAVVACVVLARVTKGFADAQLDRTLRENRLIESIAARAVEGRVAVKLVEQASGETVTAVQNLATRIDILTERIPVRENQPDRAATAPTTLAEQTIPKVAAGPPAAGETVKVAKARPIRARR